MNLFEKVLTAIGILSDDIETEILNANFTIVETQVHTAALLIKDVHVEIWMGNTPDRTRVWRVGRGVDEWYSPDIPFKSPHNVRNAIIAKGIGKDENETEDHY